MGDSSTEGGGWYLTNPPPLALRKRMEVEREEKDENGNVRFRYWKLDDLRFRENMFHQTWEEFRVSEPE